MKNAAVLLAALAAAPAAVAQSQPQAPTPVPQNVVAPSLPDQPNKEGKVSPGGAMKSDAGGYVDTKMGQVDPNAPKTGSAAPSKAGGSTGAVAPGPGIVVPPTPGPSDKGKTVVGAAFLTVKGVVKSFEKGVSVTVTEASGRERTVPLARGAQVYDGLAAGDKVVVRIPLQKPADGASADRVEKQKPPKAAKSKFAEQQTR